MHLLSFVTTVQTQRVLLVALLLLLPSVLSAQRPIRVTSVYGPVEHQTLISRAFVPLSSSTETVNVGDRVLTGPGATLMLELPDGAFMIVHENSMLTIPEPSAPSLKNVIHVAMGKVRFYIQRLGGKSNSVGAGTATALIAVRG